ncbi:unnamed protein product [Cladocopium goreaui]|uniref:Calcium-binding protein 8 n=1 Tax=Cladocopium goreaui TaxID=2562237 RepID=A0A9P1G6P8_9DINO|nr:unnamed protein product [Cladocopium goreaui]
MAVVHHTGKHVGFPRGLLPNRLVFSQDIEEVGEICLDAFHVVCIEQKFSMTIILSESAEASFKRALSHSYLQEVRAGLGAMDVRGAKATSTADEDLIKRLILKLGKA